MPNPQQTPIEIELTPEEVTYIVDLMSEATAKLKRRATPKRIREEHVEFLVPATTQMWVNNSILRKLHQATGKASGGW